MRPSFFIALVICIICSYVNSIAEDTDDSLKTYRLGEIISTANKNSKMINLSKIDELQFRDISKSNALSVSDLKIIIPSANFVTNSRGESLLYIRNAGERQTGIYFEGAQFNIPWDNRVDLSLIPTDIIGNLKIIKGAGSILYGANVLGGAIEINTIERANDGYGLFGRVQAGDGNQKSFSLTADGRTGKFNFVANGGYSSTAGIILPGNTPDFINQKSGSALRTNTDFERLNLYGRAEYKFNGITAGISISHLDAEKGVQPEGTYLAEDTRYWRIPDWKRTMIILNGESKSNNSETLIKMSLWYDIFNQLIDDYKDLNYTLKNESLEDYDLTTGGRAAISQSIAENQIIDLFFNFILNTHEQSTIQSDTNFSKNYSLNLFSIGADYKLNIGLLDISAGIGVDNQITPLTGSFTESEGSSSADWSAVISLGYNLAEDFNIYANIGRKTRFPTMREMYDAAIGKFTVNPDLKSETGILTEAGIKLITGDINWDFALFYNSYDDMIVRINDPLNKSKKMRVNLAQGRNTGLEAGAAYRPNNKLSIYSFLTFSKTEVKNNSESEWTNDVEYKPEILWTVSAEYVFPLEIQLLLQSQYTGAQKGESPYDGFVEIEPTVILDSKISKKIILDRKVFEAYIRINNITDTYRLSKLGITEAGRFLSAGVVFNI